MSENFDSCNVSRPAGFDGKNFTKLASKLQKNISVK